MSQIADVVHAVAREGFGRPFGRPQVAGPQDAEWRKLRDAGTRLWLDTGDMAEAEALWNAEFEALTTNNTLLNREVQKGIYDGLIADAAARIRKAVPGIDERLLVLEIAFVLNARHALRLVERFDARVSVELHTDLADDVGRTVAYGKRYFAVCPERFYIKVPLTAAGLLGARALARDGIPVNFTLGFSARQNVVAARVANPAFVNVFMGRLNAFVADNRLGDGANFGEKATLATQRELLALRKAGRSASLLIGASMRGPSQVASLAGVDVFTMPPKVAAAYRASPAARVASEVATDPPVSLAGGTGLSDINAATLWDVPREFTRCVDALLQRDLGAMTAEALRGHFQSSGFGDFLPSWSAEELATVAADGKIPVFATWRDKLRSGAIGLDALMNVSALFSFVSDQKALDDRIRAQMGA